MPEDNGHWEKNTQDLFQLHKKYFIHRNTSFIGKKIERIKWRIENFYAGKKKNRIAIIKLNRIPKEFFVVFDSKSYILANVDLEKSLKEGHLNSALEHFVLFGYDEVRRGNRRIGKQFPLMTEIEYAGANPDVSTAVEKGEFSSAFVHFLQFGYEEFLAGERELPGTYPFELSISLRDHVKSYFNEKAYLKMNPDVVSAIKNEEFEGAWDHLVTLGLGEIRRGERSLHSLVPKISDKLYALHNPDIFDTNKYANANSPFEHFLHYGIEEIIAGERIVKGSGIYRFSEAKLTKMIQHKLENFSDKPLISIVMPVYNVDPKWLEFAIKSVENQWYGNWELCIADDRSNREETVAYLKQIENPKIKLTFLKENLNISAASNEALKLASGQYIALMDHDDELTPDALYEVVKAINDSSAEFIYSDEDKIEMDGQFSDPHFKADFSPDMFLSQNYISHLTVIKKSLIESVSGWTVGLEGSQDYDLYLRILEKTDKIVHIPKVLYHWRKVPGSTAAEFSEKSYAQKAGRKALQNAMERREINAEVLDAKYPGTYRVKYTINTTIDDQPSTNEQIPLVSIIIPFKDKPELLDMCINSILDKSTYQNYEIIGMSNNSEEKATFEMMKMLEAKDARVYFYEYNEPFNYSAINNYAVVNYAKGEHIVLLNNDIEIISPEWIEAMLAFSQRKDIGAVGAKLYYPDDTIQHAGVIIGIGGVAGHSHKNFTKDQAGYFSRISIIQNISAVTAACLMIKKSIFTEMHGLNEKDLKIAFNDVDFCLRIQEAGYTNIYTPYCEAYHYESISRGEEDDSEKVARFNEEVNYMRERHKIILKKGDPYYNPNLTLTAESFGYQQKDTV